MRIEIDDMFAEDASNVVKFWKAAGIRRLPSRRALTRFLDMGSGKIMKINNKIVAATLFSICGPGLAYFEHFAVATGRRRGGLGRHLYKKCTAHLFKQGVRRVVFLVSKQNAGAHAFWTAVGTAPILGARAYFGKLKS